MVFSPLYLSQLGKGRILVVGWFLWTKTPPQLQQAVGGRFYAHAVKWLAQAGPADPSATSRPSPRAVAQGRQ